MDFDQATQAIIAIGKRLDTRGFVPATGGNLSCRLNGSEIAITVSGTHKGYLSEQDIMRVDMNGASLDGKKPSAETLLHTGFYHLKPEAAAVVHGHPRAGVAYTRVQAQDNSVTLSGYELLKAFPGIKTHQGAVTLPIFENSQDMPALQREVNAWYAEHPETPFAYLVRGHGLTTAGADLYAAYHLFEAIEEMLAYELTMRRAA